MRIEQVDPNSELCLLGIVMEFKLGPFRSTVQLSTKRAMHLRLFTVHFDDWLNPHR